MTPTEQDKELREAICDAMHVYPEELKYRLPNSFGNSELEAIMQLITADRKRVELEASEIYVPVRGYEGYYEVSNLGNVRSLPRGRNTGVVLKPSTRVRNYQCVSLSKSGVRKVHNIHRLVADAFISNPDGKRTVNHKDSNPKNNEVTNLEWATHSENERHARSNGKQVWNKGRLGVPAHFPRIAELKAQQEEV